MITKIYLVRHTQSIGNIEDRLTGKSNYDITKEGQEYVDLMTEKLKNIKFDNVYSSTSIRTIKTIMQLAKINNKDVITSEELCEMDFGIYDGMRSEEHTSELQSP